MVYSILAEYCVCVVVVGCEMVLAGSTCSIKGV